MIRKSIAWVCLLLSLVYVFAETQYSTRIILDMKETYVFTIPASISLPYDAEYTQVDLAVSDVFLGSGRKLSMRVSNGEGMLRSESGDALPFSLYKKDKKTRFDRADYNADGTDTLYVYVSRSDWHAAAAGEYSGVITFNLNITG